MPWPALGQRRRPPYTRPREKTFSASGRGRWSCHALLCFNRQQPRTVDAITARLFPSAGLGPEAPEAGVTDSID